MSITPGNRRIKGVLCILCAAFGFALMNMFVKLSGDLPTFQKAFFRNFIALLVALALLKKEHVHYKFNKQEFWLLFLRSAFGTAGLLCNFYAVDHLVLADANMLNKLSPFFAIIFSYFLLKEKVTPMQVFAVLVAFAGSLCIIKPSFDFTKAMPATIGLTGGIMAGAAYTFVRMLGQRGVPGPFIVAFFSAFSCLVTLPYLIFAHAPMSAYQLAMLLLAGVAASLGQFGITAAYKFAPAKEISVFDYSQVVFSAVLGFFVFRQVPDGWSVLGYVMIIAIAIVMAVYNNRQGQKQTEKGK